MTKVEGRANIVMFLASHPERAREGSLRAGPLEEILREYAQDDA
jgi:hypothetical protein